MTYAEMAHRKWQSMRLRPQRLRRLARLAAITRQIRRGYNLSPASIRFARRWGLLPGGTERAKTA